MKKRFVVELTKTICYEVEAETIDEAEKFVADIESDKEAEVQWAIVPYTEITIRAKEELKWQPTHAQTFMVI